MLTTVTPEAQELSIVSIGATPSKLTPYPMLVGTPITGAETRPATTLVSAPSIPATAMTTLASINRSNSLRSRCSPATPTS